MIWYFSPRVSIVGRFNAAYTLLAAFNRLLFIDIEALLAYQQQRLMGV
jgi:hypothetical protein